MNKRIQLWGGLAAILAIAVITGIYLASDDSPEPTTADDIISAEMQNMLQVKSDDWVKGNPDADVVVVKFSDFQCPACRQAAMMDASVEDELGDEVAFVYRHFPLPTMPHSRTAARYAEAAGKQGKFWEMHNMIFNYQQRWSRGDAQGMFDQMAENLDLDEQQFLRDLESTEIEERIESHLQDGRRLGVQGVPALFINGQQLQYPGSPDEFREMLESYL